MTLRVEKIQVSETTKAENSTKIEKQEEQTFDYQPTDDDKNIGLKVQTKDNETQKSAAKSEQNKPSTGKLIINRTGLVIMAPITAAAGVLTLVGYGVNGLLNPNSTFDQSMQEGIKAAGQGADMLQKMWVGRFF